MGKPQARKTQLYGNCIVLNVAGEPIFRTSQKRCRWYVDRGLARYRANGSEGGPTMIEFTFKAGGNGWKNDSFYMQSRDNECVVCGTKEELCRTYVVPFGLRKHFPTELKDHSHFDVVQMCMGCQRKHSLQCDKFFRELCDTMMIPQCGHWEDRDMHITRLKARAAAGTLFHHWESDKIPTDRIHVLRAYVNAAYPGVDTMKRAVLKTIKDSPVPSPMITSAHELLVLRFKDNPELVLKMIVWPFRLNFLQTMQPKYMPKGWAPERISR